jgi:DNA-binding transcriptional MocR family regulator
VRWNKPTGGFFLTVQVPFRVDDAELIRSAPDLGAIWTPMKYFYPAGSRASRGDERVGINNAAGVPSAATGRKGRKVISNCVRRKLRAKRRMWGWTFR